MFGPKNEARCEIQNKIVNQENGAQESDSDGLTRLDIDNNIPLLQSIK